MDEPAIIRRCDKLIDKGREEYGVVELFPGRPRVIIYDNHPVKVSKLCIRMGLECGLTDGQLEEFTLAALLHDSGKAHEEVCGPRVWFDKEGRTFTQEYRDLFTRAHTQYGPDMIDRIAQVKGFEKFPKANIQKMKDCAKNHHPLIDPERASRSIEVKILAVVDGFDGRFSTERPYRDGLPVPIQQSLDEMWLQARRGVLDIDLVRLYIEKFLRMEVPSFQ